MIREMSRLNKLKDISQNLNVAINALFNVVAVMRSDGSFYKTPEAVLKTIDDLVQSEQMALDAISEIEANEDNDK
jgi:hypothetical protein